jgi:hypothetical protein
VTPVFGATHYTRNWKLLECVGSEWETLRTRHRLGSKATRQQIDAVWDDIIHRFKYLQQLHRHIFTDNVLHDHLRKCFVRRISLTQRRGFNFERILPVVLMRIFWLVVRTASKTHSRFSAELSYWGRWWTEENLTKELERAIDDLSESEEVRGVQLPLQDRADRTRDDLGHPIDLRGPVRIASIFELMTKSMNERDAQAFKDWWHNCHESTESEEDAIAQRHGMTRQELNRVIATAIANYRRNRPTQN